MLSISAYKMNKFDFENSIGFIINRTAKALIRAFDQELRNKFGITFGQWKIIIILANNDDGLSQKEIADKLGLESPTIIPIIDKLEKDGFVNRMVDKNDRRNNQIFLTEKTTSLLDSIINYTLKINEISIMNVSEQDISITKHTLEKMWQNIQNEFNLNLQIDNKRKRYSTAAQLIGINTNIQ
jgi:MarR family transcriptional regulator, transcriptional regulator for hemolysin